MERTVGAATVHSRQEDEMTVLWTLIVLTFVVGVLAVVAYGIYELSPFAHHSESYRDPSTGTRQWQSPHLDSRDEFERGEV
jgi:hypothetical protein